MGKPNGSNIGKKNVYVCQSCRHHIVTIDRADGVTPFVIRCKRDKCKGTMHSAFYKPLPMLLQMQTPDFEWYRKSKDELIGLDEDALTHHSKGGLFLREYRANIIERHIKGK